MADKFKWDREWAEAKKRCPLNQDDIRKAKELNISPRSLIKNIPSKSQQWKAPVKIWISDLYEKQEEKIAARKAKKAPLKARRPTRQAPLRRLPVLLATAGLPPMLGFQTEACRKSRAGPRRRPSPVLS